MKKYTTYLCSSLKFCVFLLRIGMNEMSGDVVFTAKRFKQCMHLTDQRYVQ